MHETTSATVNLRSTSYIQQKIDHREDDDTFIEANGVRAWCARMRQENRQRQERIRASNAEKGVVTSGRMKTTAIPSDGQPMTRAEMMMAEDAARKSCGKPPVTRIRFLGRRCQPIYREVETGPSEANAKVILRLLKRRRAQIVTASSEMDKPMRRVRKVALKPSAGTAEAAVPVGHLPDCSGTVPRRRSGC